MVQVVDMTDCTRGKLTCSIKEGRKQSHTRKSAEMSSQWKRNNPEKHNAGSWTRGWMKSPEKDITSSAVMCATPHNNFLIIKIINTSIVLGLGKFLIPFLH